MLVEVVMVVQVHVASFPMLALAAMVPGLSAFGRQFEGLAFQFAHHLLLSLFFSFFPQLCLSFTLFYDPLLF